MDTTAQGVTLTVSVVVAENMPAIVVVPETVPAIDAHYALYDDDEDYSPEDDGNSVNEDNKDDTSEELVAIDEDEFQELHDDAPVVVPETVPAVQRQVLCQKRCQRSSDR